jgi:hypothetical protein
MEKGLKLLCKRCAIDSGLAFSGTLVIDDGFKCPVCDHEENEGRLLGEEIGD